MSEKTYVLDREFLKTQEVILSINLCVRKQETEHPIQAKMCVF